MSQSSTLRAVMIGLGAAARNIHRPALKLTAGIELVAGCDPLEEARSLFAPGSPGLPLFSSVNEMLKEASADVAIVTSPPDHHHAAVMESLEAGCHVLCEKPFAVSLAEADQMIEASRQRERWIVVNHEFREIPIYKQARAAIGSEQFGRVLFAHAWQTFHPTPKTEAGWRSNVRRRLCLDFGVHVLDLMRFFFDSEPVRVFAHMPNPFGAATCDVVNTIVLDFTNGRSATIVLDRLSKGPQHYLELRLDGENGAIQTSIGGQLRLEGGLRTHDRRPFARLHVAGGGTAHLQHGDRSTLLARAPINPFVPATARVMEGLALSIRTGASPAHGAMEGRASLALALAAYQSAELGVPIEMSAFTAQSVIR